MSLQQDGSYNWDTYEGAYWTGEPLGVSYYHRHDGSRTEWRASAPEGYEESVVAEGKSAAGLAAEMREFANAVLAQADEVEALVPEIPAERKTSESSPFASVMSSYLLDALRPSSAMSFTHDFASVKFVDSQEDS